MRIEPQRANIAIVAGRHAALDATSGLNEELTEFKRFWDAGHLAVVQGIGYPNADLSHFNSMATWMSGSPNGVPSSGWLGRWLDGHLGSTKNLFAAAEIGHSLPLHLVGRVQRGTTVPAGQPMFGGETSAQYQNIYSSLRTISAPGTTTWKGRIGQAIVDQLDVAKTLLPVIPATLPDAAPTARLEVMARLINANLGFRVFTAGWGDFDSHANEPDDAPDADGRAERRRQALLRDPQPRLGESGDGDDVLRVRTHQLEQRRPGHRPRYGGAALRVRRPREGRDVRPAPDAAGPARWDRMAHHVDFRDYYGSVIDGWMGGGGSDVVNKPVNDLGLFLAADVPVDTDRARGGDTGGHHPGHPAPMRRPERPGGSWH